jgi:acyl-CoA synthetase (AMP-forming)/AMP-acid ligase II
MTLDDYLCLPFGTLTDLIEIHALERPTKPALVGPAQTLTYVQLADLTGRVAAGLAEGGVSANDSVAICAAVTSVNYAIAFLGILRLGAVVVPLAPSSTAQSLRSMLKDCDARALFLDEGVRDSFAEDAMPTPIMRIALDQSEAGLPFDAWLARSQKNVPPALIEPDQAFNIIYSSGTTGTPKGIVQPHRFRWGQCKRGVYTEDAVTIISTPLYSNTTLVSFLPTIAGGGTAVLMPKFDAGQFLALSEQHRVTHAMLVPVQYRRLMQHPRFDAYDLSSFRLKFSTSAPFSAALKAEVLRRWPGGLIEYYGMTEGGGSCMLVAHEFPDKLGTVGMPMPEHEIRLIDEQGVEVSRGEIGEVVGRSGSMMRGYHNQPEKTREAEWFSPEGLRFIRTGDIGRFDDDGFLTLMDRKKDMIISGGFNIYPSDLEAQIVQHPSVMEAAVLGAPSETWGETPVAAVVLRIGQSIDADALRHWVNERLGKTQRLAELRIVDALPRSAIGKVLKRELRQNFGPRL